MHPPPLLPPQSCVGLGIVGDPFIPSSVYGYGFEAMGINFFYTYQFSFDLNNILKSSAYCFILG
jgi:hypothetical protein